MPVSQTKNELIFEKTYWANSIWEIQFRCDDQTLKISSFRSLHCLGVGWSLSFEIVRLLDWPQSGKWGERNDSSKERELGVISVNLLSNSSETRTSSFGLFVILLKCFWTSLGPLNVPNGFWIIIMVRRRWNMHGGFVYCIHSSKCTLNRVGLDRIDACVWCVFAMWCIELFMNNWLIHTLLFLAIWAIENWSCVLQINWLWFVLNHFCEAIVYQTHTHTSKCNTSTIQLTHIPHKQL